jgi:CxxC motif-containing protein
VTRIETVICIGCPMGCEIKLSVGNKGEITGISGNRCKEGKKYASQEYKNPVRVLTATLRTANSRQPLLPVRTGKPILKKLLLRSMPVLAKVVVKAPVKLGQVVVPNLLNTGIDVIATDDLLSYKQEEEAVR